MSQQDTNLPQDVEGSSPSGAGSVGMARSGSVSSSAKLAAETISAGSKPASPAINPPQGVHGIHDGATSPSKAILAAVGSAGMAASNSSSVKLASEDRNGGSKPTSPLVVHASEKNTESNLASLVVVHAGENSGGAGSNSKSIRSSSGGDVQDDVKDAPKPAVDGGGDSSSSSKGKGAAAETDHAPHMSTERKRRKKMKNLYSTLHSLLPRLPGKADKATIVGEAVDFIKTLEGTVQRLENLKVERMRAQQLGAGSSSAAPAPLMSHGGTPAPATRESVLADMVLEWNTQQAAAAVARGAVAPPLGPFQTWSAPNIAVSMTGKDTFISVCAPRQHSVQNMVLYVLDKYHIDVVTMNLSADENRSMFCVHARINTASARFPENVMKVEDRFKLAVSEILRSITK